MMFADLLPLVEGRPAAELAERIQPQVVGTIPPAIPPDWIPGKDV
jgi:hypothetical protein